MDLHQILVRSPLSISVVLHLIIINGLEAILLDDVKQLFLQLNHFADHLAVEFKNLVLLRVFIFVLIRHPIGYIDVDLVLHFDLQLA
jgi:hypothetical protein